MPLAPKKSNTPIVGLLGGPGSGKSTVARTFEHLGCVVVLADAINHQLLATSEVIDHLKSKFGARVMCDDGAINRSKLGDIVFNDPEQRAWLNDYLHPQIALIELAQIEKAQRDPLCKAIILDIPLLLEVGHDKWCNSLVFIEVTTEIRHERLLKRTSWTVQKIKNIEKTQIALDTKRKISDHIISNSADLEVLGSQVEEILSLIIKQC